MEEIYFLSEEGATTVIADGPEFQVLATNELQEKCQASMAVSDGQFFIRTRQRLFCRLEARGDALFHRRDAEIAEKTMESANRPARRTEPIV